MSAQERVVRVGLVVAVAFIVFMPTRAEAHTDVVKTSPEAGTVLESPPATVSITFNEPVSTDLAVVAVTDGQGESSQPDVEQVDPNTIRVGTRASARDGRWTVSYRVVSVDGHPVSGSFGFRVRPASPTPTPSAPSADPSADPSAETSPPTSTNSTRTRSPGEDRVLSTIVIGFITLGGVLLTLWLIARAGTRSRT